MYSEVLVIDEDGRVQPESEQRWLSTESPSGDVFDQLLRENFIPSPATMMRRSSVEEVGGWDEELVLDDWDLFLRLADRHPDPLLSRSGRQVSPDDERALTAIQLAPSRDRAAWSGSC